MIEKTKRLVLLIFLFTIWSTVFCQDLEYAKHVVQTLASPEFKGRGYSDDGNKMAAEFIEKQFAQIGLKPFRKDYSQPFKVEVNTFPGKMKLYFDETELTPGIDYIIDPLSSSLEGEYDFNTINAQDLLNNQKVKNIINQSQGKILIIDLRDYKPDNKELKQNLDEIVGFFKYSPQISISGIIELTSEKLLWGNYTVQASRASFIVNKEFDYSSIKKIKVEALAQLVSYKTRNIIGYIEGKTYPDSFLVSIAHYDHLGRMGSDTYFSGANDNASGIAMMLSLAKYYQQNPPKYSMVFIALAAEEIGLIGAKYFVDNPLIDLKKIKFLVNFDLAGTGDDGIKVVNGSIYKKQFETLTVLNEKGNYLKSVQVRGEACNGDHCMFYQKGVPCFNIYTLGGISAYHDIYDKAETLPLTEFVDYSKLMIDFFNSF